MIPPRSGLLNPNYYWMKDMHDHARRMRISSIKDLKMYFHYDSRRIEREVLKGYFHKTKSFMVAELNKKIEIGFTQAIKSIRTSELLKG
jgi:hypothetical protein